MRLMGITAIAIAAVVGDASGQTVWQQTAHVGRIDTVRASRIDEIFVPAPGTYFAATDKGIFRSTNAGAGWSAPRPPSAYGFFLHPDGRIFTGTGNGLEVSTDGGVTWSRIATHPAIYTGSILRDPQGRMFTAVWGSSSTTGRGVYRSTDEGATWSNVVDTSWCETLTLGPGNAIYAGGHKWIRRSTDGGLTWELLYGSAGIRSITVAQDGSILIGWYLFSPDLTQLTMATYRSTDNGSTWGPVAGFYSEFYAKDEGNYIYAATDSGMRRTTDNGTTWQVLNAGLLNRNGAVPWLRTLNRVGPTEFLAGEYHTGEIFRSTDLGEHWSTVSTVEYRHPTSAKLSALAFKAPDGLFIGSSLFGMQKWTEGGGLEYINSGLGSPTVQTIYVGRTGNVYAGTATGVFRSTDNGTTWAKFGTNALSIRALGDLATGDVLLGVGQGVLRLSADGATAATMNTGLVNRTVNAFWTGTDGRTFAGTEDGLYRLDNLTWVPVAVSAGALKVTDVEASGQFLALATRDSGVYVSTDNGQNWQPKRVGLEGYTVRGLVLAPSEMLYAATEQNGVFKAGAASGSWTAISDGLNDPKMRGLVFGTDDYLYAVTDSGAVLKLIITAVRDAAPAIPATFALEQNYPNPFNPGTAIRYGLPRRCSVLLRVFNALGQQVAVLDYGEREAGYHDVTFDASGLASGVYLLRLAAGDVVQSRKMLLLR